MKMGASSLSPNIPCITKTAVSGLEQFRALAIVPLLQRIRIEVV